MNLNKKEREREPTWLGSVRPQPKAWVEPRFFGQAKARLDSNPEKTCTILLELSPSLEFQLTSWLDST